MPNVADVLRRHGPEYLARFGQRMPPEQKKVLGALSACRTGQLGTVHYHCTSCGQNHVMGRSCGNRHCPTCQRDKAQVWLDRQLERLLPCPYFLVTFTVPAQLRRLIRSHPRVCYQALFEASSAALKTLAADKRFVGTRRPGFVGVLHTWGRKLTTFHPHIHYLVPGGGLSRDGARWLPSRSDFFVHVKPLSILFRQKFQRALQRAGLHDQIDPLVWSKEFVTDSRAVGDGRSSLKYLAPYVFRVAITDRRIVSLHEQTDGSDRVTYLYKKSGSRQWHKTTVDAIEFIRSFLQHVLPAGFQKVRHYGFLASHSKTHIEAVRWTVALYYQQLLVLLQHSQQVTQPPPRIRCGACGGPMVLIGFRPPLPAAPPRAPPPREAA